LIVPPKYSRPRHQLRGFHPRSPRHLWEDGRYSRSAKRVSETEAPTAPTGESSRRIRRIVGVVAACGCLAGLLAGSSSAVVANSAQGTLPKQTQEVVASPIQSQVQDPIQSPTPSPSPSLAGGTWGSRGGSDTNFGAPRPIVPAVPSPPNVVFSQTLSLGDRHQVKSPAGYSTMQGGVFDGTHIYATFNSQSSGRIVKIDAATGAVVQTSSRLDMGHANAIGLDKENHRLVISARNYSSGADTHKLYFVKTSDLTFDEPKSTITSHPNSGLICHNDVTGEYVIGSGTWFGLYDSAFRQESQIIAWPGMWHVAGLTQAGGFCDSQRIYLLGSKSGGSSSAKDNAILVFDWSGRFIDAYYVAPPSGRKLEIEGGFVDRSGQAYVFYNDFGPGPDRDGYAPVVGLVSPPAP